MDIDALVAALAEQAGDLRTGALIGLVVGVVFGLAAQRSAFCLRSAAIEFGRGRLGPGLSIWLLTFSTAMCWVQGAQLMGWFNAGSARMMAVTGSISGAIIGGLIFGFGMIMTRGCSGRLLVLAGTGNFRSIVSGMVFAISAQVSLSGMLAPARQWVAALWTTEGGRNVDLGVQLGFPEWGGFGIGLVIAVVAIVLSLRNGMTTRRLVWACGAGFAVALGWILTFTLARNSFEPQSVTSATFSGPSANALMYVLDNSALLNFDIGLIPGVFIGAFIGGSMGNDLRLESYSSAGQMARSMTGGALMGFGAMLAGGCAIGAGLSGTSIYVMTAWLATVCFFIGGGIADRIFDAPAARAHAPVAPAH